MHFDRDLSSQFLAWSGVQQVGNLIQSFPRYQQEISAFGQMLA